MWYWVEHLGQLCTVILWCFSEVCIPTRLNACYMGFKFGDYAGKSILLTIILVALNWSRSCLAVTLQSLPVNHWLTFNLCVTYRWSQARALHLSGMISCCRSIAELTFVLNRGSSLSCNYRSVTFLYCYSNHYYYFLNNFLCKTFFNLKHMEIRS